MSASIGTVALIPSAAAPGFIAVSLRATSVNYFALGLLCAVLWLGTGKYRKLVNVQVLSFYGFISYGLYLIHPLIFSLYNDMSAKFASWFHVEHNLGKCLLRLLAVLAVATAAAYVSRTTYEEFFLRMKSKLDKPRERPETIRLPKLGAEQPE